MQNNFKRTKKNKAPKNDASKSRRVRMFDIKGEVTLGSLEEIAQVGTQVVFTALTCAIFKITTIHGFFAEKEV